MLKIPIPFRIGMGLNSLIHWMKGLRMGINSHGTDWEWDLIKSIILRDCEWELIPILGTWNGT